MRRGAVLALALGLTAPLPMHLSLIASAQAHEPGLVTTPPHAPGSKPITGSMHAQGLASTFMPVREPGLEPVAAPMPVPVPMPVPMTVHESMPVAVHAQGLASTRTPVRDPGLLLLNTPMAARGLQPLAAPSHTPGLGPLAAPMRGSALEGFGTTMKYALPLAAAACAADQDRLEDFAVRGVLQAVVVLGLKSLFDGHPRGLRPSGEGRGYPSGHAAAAGFGAADLAGKCWRDEPGLGAAAYGAAGLTAVSRVQAGQHTPEQVWAGSLIGIGFGAASLGLGSEGASISFGLRF